MLESMMIFFIFIKVFTFGVGVFFLVLTYRVIKPLKHQLLLRDIKISTSSLFYWPKVSLIVPVCNEEDTVEKAALSLLRMDYANIEFIFVNDRSTDNTENILQKLALLDPRVKTITIRNLPSGWLGKVNAFEQGRKLASGDWLLFSDADVHYQCQSLKKAIFYVLNEKLDFLAVLPSIVGGTFFVRLLLAQSLQYLTLMVNFSKISQQNYPDAIAHGAFMLVQKEAYNRSKGFEWLKMEVIDDIGLAVELKRSGSKIGVLSGLDEIEFEWYPTTKALIKGFEKNGFASMQYSKCLLCSIVFGISMIFAGYTIFPLLTKSMFIMIFVWSAMLSYLIATAYSLRRIINMSSWSVLLFPFTALILPYITFRSAIKCLRQKGIFWRGTFYSLHELKKEQRLRIIKISPQ